MRVLALIIFVFLLTGCTTVGTFVTDINVDEEGNLIIQKKRIRQDMIIHRVDAVEDKEIKVIFKE
ncbi:hypothetical protein KKA27_03005 [Patescibacteria group bacterium]|nr:hypothetical protein [Patescibacteria group bacterium]